MKNEITLDFCVWLQRNFDEILAEGPEWHVSIQPSKAQVAAVSALLSKPIAPVQKQAEEPDWDMLRKIAAKHDEEINRMRLPWIGKYQ